MGSDSDLPVMAVGARILKQFGVPFELTIVSAHRTPHRMSEYAIEAPKEVLNVLLLVPVVLLIYQVWLLL